MRLRLFAVSTLCAGVLITTIAATPLRRPARPVSNGYPVWSPDGTQIAFHSNRTGDYEIFVMGADGSNPRQLTDRDGLDIHPSWSPDGRRIVFASARGIDTYSSAGRLQIVVIDADGRNEQRLTTNSVSDFAPDWSPDGRRIAFVSDREGTREVYVMNADGTQQRSVTGSLMPKGRERGNPHWLADGTHLLFDGNTTADRVYYAFKIDVDGRELARISQNASDVFFATISPDGTWIAYCELFGDDWEIVVAKSDGTSPTRITSSPGFDFWPTWSPDSRRLAFASNRSGALDIYTVNRDGSAVSRLTNDGGR